MGRMYREPPRRKVPLSTIGACRLEPDLPGKLLCTLITDSISRPAVFRECLVKDMRLREQVQVQSSGPRSDRAGSVNASPDHPVLSILLRISAMTINKSAPLTINPA
jgi:hypothetical protein